MQANMARWRQNSLRRSLLAGIAISYASLFLAKPVWAKQAADSDHDAFLKLSRLITGRNSPDAAQAELLFKALSEDDARFSPMAQSLLQYVKIPQSKCKRTSASAGFRTRRFGAAAAHHCYCLVHGNSGNEAEPAVLPTKKP